MRRSYSNLHDILENLRYGSDKQLEAYINRKGNVNLCDGYDRTLLMLSVLDNNHSRVKMLISSGCQLNSLDHSQNTALSHSVKSGNFLITRTLLENGAYLNIMDHDKQTPLSVAVQRKDFCFTKLLLSFGADSNAVCGGSPSALGTALIYAIDGKDVQICEEILTAPQTNIHSHLEVCVKSHNPQAFRYLLSHGANCFIPSVNGESSLFEFIIHAWVSDLKDNQSYNRYLSDILSEYGNTTSVQENNEVLLSLPTMQELPQYWQLMNYLLESGMIPRNAYLKSSLTSISDLDKIKNLCREFTSAPSLQNLCRTAIREVLQFGISLKVTRLPIPVKLQKYLNLSQNFLPFTCENCRLVFCLNHKFPDSHHCFKFDQQKSLPEYKGTKGYSCSYEGCDNRELMPVVCEKCSQNFCLSHRHEIEHKCVKLEIKSTPTKTAEHVRQILASKQNTNHVKKARTKKASKTAAKVALMKMKMNAIGDKKIPETERVYFNVILPLCGANVTSKQLFLSKMWTVGRAIDYTAEKSNITNPNNTGSEKKLRLFSSEDGCLLQIETTLEYLLKEEKILNGGNLILECVLDNCLEINTELYGT